MKLIYVAGPYRAQTKERRDLHIEQAKLTAVLLLEKGWFPVNPILNTARFEEYTPWTPDNIFLDGTLEDHALASKAFWRFVITGFVEGVVARADAFLELKATGIAWPFQAEME